MQSYLQILVYIPYSNHIYIYTFIMIRNYRSKRILKPYVCLGEKTPPEYQVLFVDSFNWTLIRI